MTKAQILLNCINTMDDARNDPSLSSKRDHVLAYTTAYRILLADVIAEKSPVVCEGTCSLCLNGQAILN